MMTVMGFDFGMKYIGVAIGQTITKTASSLTSVLAKDGIPHWQNIERLINEWSPSLLVVGIPVDMKGQIQWITHCAKKFAKRLKHYQLEVKETDESLTSWEARKYLYESGADFQKLNAMAATILLEQWLRTSY